MTADELLEHAIALKPGQSMVYHTGELGYDAMWERAKGNPELWKTQRVMLQCGMPLGKPIVTEPIGAKPQTGLGLGYLTQRRLTPIDLDNLKKPGTFDYIFTRASGIVSARAAA